MTNKVDSCPKCSHRMAWFQCDRCHGSGDDPNGRSGEYPCDLCESVGDRWQCTHCDYTPLTEREFWGAAGYRYGVSIGVEMNTSAEDVFDYAIDRRGDLNAAYSLIVDKDKARQVFEAAFGAALADHERFGRTF